MPDGPERASARITIRSERCIGSGNCVVSAGGYFDQNDEDARVILLRDVVVAGDLAEVRDAVRGCPVAAVGLRPSTDGS